MAFGTLQIVALLALFGLLVAYDSIITICLCALVNVGSLIEAFVISSRYLSMLGPSRAFYFCGSFYTCSRLSFRF